MTTERFMFLPSFGPPSRKSHFHGGSSALQSIFLTQMFRTETLVVASISIPNIPA